MLTDHSSLTPAIHFLGLSGMHLFRLETANTCSYSLKTGNQSRCLPDGTSKHACNAQGRDKGFRVCKTKMDHTAKQLCPQSWPSAFRKFLEVSQALRYEEEPYYEACMRLFRPLLGSSVPKELTGTIASPVPVKVASSCLTACA